MHPDDDGGGDGDHPGGAAAEEWDRAYAENERRWSGRPNGALVAEVEALGASGSGSALDVGCGEGADAIWLAGRGFAVTAVDISRVALDRARRAAEEAGVEVDWELSDLARRPPSPGRYDLVCACYLTVRQAPGDDVVGGLLDAVAPGGRLIVVGHDVHGHEHHARFDPSEHVQPDDVAARLDEGWSVEVHERRARVVPPGWDGPDMPDAVLRARRL